MEQDCGRYYIVDSVRNVIAFKNIDLEAQGRDLGAIAAWEKLG